jgi:putative pyoverdin transport system ATP-binding/permease protein
MYKLRMQLCEQMLAVPLKQLEQLGTARLLPALTEDVPSITAAISIIPLLCVNAALVIGCLVYMGTLSLALLAVVMVFLVLGILSYQLPIIKVEKIFGLARKEADALQAHFRVLTEGAKELKMHSERRQAFIKEELQATAAAVQERNISGLNLYTLASSWGQVLVFIVVGLVLFALPLVRSLNAATLTGYVLTLLYLMTPLQVIMNSLPQLTRASVSLQTVSDLGFTLASEPAERIGPIQTPAGDWKKLQLRSVTHRYHRQDEGNDFVLGPLNLAFMPGEMVFVIGGNGSGKTTFVKLLTGLYAPESGHIHLNDKPVGDDNKELYRQHFAAVFSDFYLFDTMIGLGGESVDGQGGAYLDQLKLAHKVQIKNGRLSTTELSQGQRKRLALLTAFLEDRPIYVFDEWAADQDPYFKEIFYLRLLPDLKARRKTVFVITHDDRYYYVADRLIKLDEGQVVSDTLQRHYVMEVDRV